MRLDKKEKKMMLEIYIFQTIIIKKKEGIYQKILKYQIKIKTL